MYDSPPPLVFSGKAPPGAVFRSRMKAAASLHRCSRSSPALQPSQKCRVSGVG
jgi:hypothetical protein